jgi:hypothetical protein
VEDGDNGRGRDCERKNPFVIFHNPSESGMRCFSAKSDMGAPLDTRYHQNHSGADRDGMRFHISAFQEIRSSRTDPAAAMAMMVKLNRRGGDSFMCHGAQPDSRPDEGNAQEAR